VWLRAAHHCFNNYDLGIYSQGLANLSLATPNPWLSGRQIHLFADHFDPILAVAKPLVPLLGVPWAGLFTEALFVAAACLPLLWLGLKGQLDRRAALLLSAMLLFNSSTMDALGFPIHPTTWAVLPWVLLGVSIHLRRPAAVLLSLALLFACKEEFPFVGVVLGGALLLERGNRRLGLAVLGISAAWILVAFGLRPALLGPTYPYAEGLFSGLRDAPLDWLRQRLTVKAMWPRLGSMLVVFLPLALWCARARVRPSPLLLSLLLPPLAIRFLGMAWHHHYGAVLMAGAVVAFLPVAASSRPPGWVVAATALLLVTTNGIALNAVPRTLLPQAAVSFPAKCPAEPERLRRVDEALRLVRSTPGSALLEGNLLPSIADRSEIYMVGGPVPGNQKFDLVAVEKPPRGDTWPLAPDRMSALIDAWRSTPGAQVLADDEYVFVARGSFELSR
jgi:hypothetical protein